MLLFLLLTISISSTTSTEIDSGMFEEIYSKVPTVDSIKHIIDEHNNELNKKKIFLLTVDYLRLLLSSF